jgi:hypothetical protein
MFAPAVPMFRALPAIVAVPGTVAVVVAQEAATADDLFAELDRLEQVLIGHIVHDETKK